nr:hypothetical protein [Tanacetum cinerariifolium]
MYCGRKIRSALWDDGPNANSADAFNAFATEFGINKASPRTSNVNSRKEDQLDDGVERLRQDLQGLKQTLASRTPSPNKSASKSPSSAFQNQSSS